MSATPTKPGWGVLKRVFAFAKPYRNKFYLSVFLSILLAAMAPLRPLLIQTTLNLGINHPEMSRFISGPGGFIIEITLIQLVLLLVESLCRFYFTFTTASLGQSVVNDLRTSTYEKILNLNLSQFDTTPIGTLTTRTVNDIESVNEIFSDGLIPIIADLLSIISILTYMFWVSPTITLVSLAPFPLLILGTYYFKEAVNKSFLRVRNAVAALNAFVQEHLTGIHIVQAFASEEREQQKFTTINKEHRNANIRSILAYSIFFPFVELISALSIGLLVWWAAKQYGASATDTKDLAGIITSFILCVNLLFRPLRMLADKFNVLQMGMIASERVFKVLDNTDTTIDKGSYAPTHVQGRVDFNEVWFAYTQDNFVLRNVSFHIEPGKSLAIVGHTGSGKSSIISLLNRLYNYQKGEIKIDGVHIEDYELDALRSKIAVVLQDVFLFSGSITENITLRNPEITKEKVQEAARLIGMHDFIESLPGSYDYNVRERGATLSLGQRQLISFIRAILYNPAILILDEATSSVDAESEQLIQHAIDKLVSGRTSIIIAHRLSTIRKADNILVLNKGVVMETGTHNELMNNKGYYYKLYQSQFANEVQRTS